MKSVVFFLAIPLACLLIAAEKKDQTSGNGAFDGSVKILKFGELHPYYEPSKEDAVVALGLLGDDWAVPVLIEHRNNEKNAQLRFRIVETLGRLKARKAVPALEKVLKDDDIHVRKGAAMALKETTGKDYKIEDDPAANVADLEALTAELTRMQEAHRRPSSRKPSLEVGKTYCFTFGREKPCDLVDKVLEAPTGDWVKVQIRKGDKSMTSWVNLTIVAMVTVEKEEK